MSRYIARRRPHGANGAVLYDIFDLGHYISYMDPGVYPRDAAFSPDGSVLYAINGDPYDQRVYLFCTETGRSLGHIYPEIEDTRLTRIELSPDGTELYLYSTDDESVLGRYRVRGGG